MENVRVKALNISSYYYPIVILVQLTDSVILLHCQFQIQWMKI